MKLQDYIQYYFHSPMIASPNTSPDAESIECNLLSIPRSGTEYLMVSTEGVEFYSFGYTIKPILRRLEDITQEECHEYNKIILTMHSINKNQDQMKTQAAVTDYLLKQGFDLFGLIETGVAIDQKLSTT